MKPTVGENGDEGDDKFKKLCRGDNFLPPELRNRFPRPTLGYCDCVC